MDESADRPGLLLDPGADAGGNPARSNSALACLPRVGHIISTMREILPGIFTWGSTYADRPWDLNGYAITLDECTVLVDPPAPEANDWASFDRLKPITKIVLT